MTNQSPSESPNSIPERRRRPATGVTFDEIIAIIAAFSTIGAILFWAIGDKNSKLAGNFGLKGDGSSLASNKTADTGLGFGSAVSQDAQDDNASTEEELRAENRRLAAQVREQDEVTTRDIPANNTAETPAQRNQIQANSAQGNQKPASDSGKQSFSLDSGAKFVPFAGVAAIPGLIGKPGHSPQVDAEPKNVEAKPEAPVKPEAKAGGTDKPAPQTTTPQPTAAKPETAKPAQKPTAITPETTKMPHDVVPDYWAYPFVKQMRDKALVPELAKNKEFDPDGLITRASMATLVSEAFKDQPQNKDAKKFTDVNQQDTIAKNIDQAVSSGFMQGYSDDEFKPTENIPRYQVLVTLATGLGLKPSKDADQILQQFGDRGDMPDWAKEQVAAATEAGLVVNPPDAPKGSLVPEKAATRGEVAAMIHQALVKTGKLEAIKSEYIVKP